MTSPARPSRRAFTLLELLVVIGIIAILIGLLVGAGVAVLRNGKTSGTRGVLQSLDRALGEYMMANNNNIPPFSAAQFACVPGRDGPNGLFSGNDPNGDTNPAAYISSGRMPQRPDSSVFVRQARGIGDVDSILGAIPDRFSVVTAIPRDSPTDTNCGDNEFDASPSFIDSWANTQWRGLEGSIGTAVETAWPIREQSLIYYVHPNNRRDRSDTATDQYPDAQELYGDTVNGRPYFFSAGPDGFYGHPDEFLDILKHYGMAKLSTETDPEFQNRVLKQARLDNLYSMPVNIDFTISDAVLLNTIAN